LSEEIAESVPGMGLNRDSRVKLGDLNKIVELDLNGILVNDDYADDVIRTLNNPCLFDGATKAFADTTAINLQNNGI
jgi:hypothetical protein